MHSVIVIETLIIIALGWWSIYLMQRVERAEHALRRADARLKQFTDAGLVGMSIGPPVD